MGTSRSVIEFIIMHRLLLLLFKFMELLFWFYILNDTNRYRSSYLLASVVVELFVNIIQCSITYSIFSSMEKKDEVSKYCVLGNHQTPSTSITKRIIFVGMNVRLPIVQYMLTYCNLSAPYCIICCRHVKQSIINSIRVFSNIGITLLLYFILTVFICVTC